MTEFLVWCMCGVLFFILGIRAFRAKEAVGFWNIKKGPEVTEVEKYNHAVGKLWCVSGGVFAVLGLPLLAGQNSPLVLLSVLGGMFFAIGLMVIYELVIVKKYVGDKERDV